MVTATFKITHVSIEGFKGFTTRQELRLDGRHLFVLGDNGNGKSSIVEAIRWGLFGSTGRPNEVIANQGYIGRCRVELGLERSGERYRLQRTLVRGASGGSDAALIDSSGTEVSIRDVLPQLESVPAGEGMHIVYAAQSSPLRRGPEDLRPFERTIYAYLGISQLPELISLLESFEVDQQDQENTLGDEVTAKRSEIEGGIADLEQRRDNFLQNPPWGDGRTPDIRQTIQRIKRFVRRIGGQASDVGDMRSLLELAGDTLEQAGTRDLGTLQADITSISSKIEQAQTLLESSQASAAEVLTLETMLHNLNIDVANLLIGKTLEESASEVEEIEGEFKLATERITFYTIAHGWLDSSHLPDESCPICGDDAERTELLRRIEAKLQTINAGEQQAADTLTTTRERVETAKAKLDEVNGAEERLGAEKNAIQGFCEEAAALLGNAISPTELETKLAEFLQDLTERREALRSEIENKAATHADWQRGLTRLRDEVAFQSCLSALRLRRQELEQLDQIENRLGDLTTFGTTVRALRTHLQVVLNERLAASAPQINEALTKAFHGLTEHPVYDLLEIDQDRLPRLELLVKSSGDPGSGFAPSGVLNGQALSALELVPYFAFSELTEFPFDVYLLLLDDPHNLSTLITSAYSLTGFRILARKSSSLLPATRQLPLNPSYFGHFRELITDS